MTKIFMSYVCHGDMSYHSMWENSGGKYINEWANLSQLEGKILQMSCM